MIAAARIQRMTRLFGAHIIAAERRQTLYEILGLREAVAVTSYLPGGARPWTRARC
jgi:hypothetical protein